MTEPTLGQLIDQLHELRDQKREVLKQEKAIQERYDLTERAIFQKLYESDTTASRGTKASVSITEQDIATLTDFDEFVEYVKGNEAWHLLQRRVASRAAISEIESNEAEIPGIQIIKQQKLGLRTL